MKLVKMFIALVGFALITGCSNPVESKKTTPPDTTPPTVLSASPSNGAVNVPVNTVITINFSEPISPSSASVRIMAGGSTISSSVVVSSSTISVAPQSALQKSTTYSVVVPVAVTDTAGNSLAQAYLFSFTTVGETIIPDTTRPTVVSVSPTNGAVGVSANTAITINFSEPIVSPSVLLTDSVSNVPFSISVSGSTVIISPASVLENATNYNLVASASDTAGNKMTTEFKSSFTTGGTPPWSISGVSITDIATDASGNVYVTGTFNGAGQDCFVARFNPDGKVAWKKDIATAVHDGPRGGMVVVDNEVYLHHYQSVMGIGDEETFVSAYSCESGELIWRTHTWSEMVSSIVTDGSNYIYSVCSNGFMKLSLQAGSILQKYSSPGLHSLKNITIMPDGIIACGDYMTSPYKISSIWKLDLNLNMIWEKQGTANSLFSGAMSIIDFPEDSLIVIGEYFADALNGLAGGTYVSCYKLRADGLDSFWQKPFENGGFKINLKKYGNVFYVFSPDLNYAYNGPIKMSTSGSILWSASSNKVGNIAVFSEKVFVANGSTTLTVYN